MSRIAASARLQRLLALVPWVASRNGPTVDEVCERFDIRRDDLIRDLDLVQLVGVPPYTPDQLFEIIVEEDRIWVHLSPSFDRSLRLTPEQALTLVAAGASLRSVPGADPAGPLARGLDKLATTLGIDADQAVEIELGRARGDVLSALQEAVAEHRRVRLDYYAESRDERSIRTVDPFRIWADQGQWYLVAHDHLRQAERLFRLDRVFAVDTTGERFTPPDDDERTRLGLFEPGADASRVTLELPDAARWVVEVYPVERVQVADGGRLEVTLAIGSPVWLGRLLVRLGPEARVVRVAGDESLANAGRDAAARLLRRYGLQPVPSAGS